MKVAVLGATGRTGTEHFEKLACACPNICLKRCAPASVQNARQAA
jgi:hypothetical protein